VTGHVRFATESYWFTVRWPLKIVVTVVLLTAISALGLQTFKHARESHWKVRADEQSANVTNRIECLKEAFALEPKNPQTAYDLGETLRLQSWEGAKGFETLATEAMSWFQKAIQLNPYDPYPWIRYGMCLDWLERHQEAEGYFKKANELDPNWFYTSAHMGWHYFQVGDYVTARKWFQRSLAIFWHENPMSRAYLEILKSKLPENAKP